MTSNKKHAQTCLLSPEKQTSITLKRYCDQHGIEALEETIEHQGKTQPLMFHYIDAKPHHWQHPIMDILTLASENYTQSSSKGTKLSRTLATT